MTIYKLAITRFDNNTYRENREWCKASEFNGSIYGSPIRISESILPETILLILEMNNSINQIMGIGIIKCGCGEIISDKKKYRIYSDNNYNRFIYQSKYRIDFAVEYLPLGFYKKIVLLEKLLFKGSRHSKRGQGINLMPLWIIVEFKKFGFIDDILAILQRICTTSFSASSVGFIDFTK